MLDANECIQDQLKKKKAQKATEFISRTLLVSRCFCFFSFSAQAQGPLFFFPLFFPFPTKTNNNTATHESCHCKSKYTMVSPPLILQLQVELNAVVVLFQAKNEKLNHFIKESLALGCLNVTPSPHSAPALLYFLFFPFLLFYLLSSKFWKLTPSKGFPVF